MLVWYLQRLQAHYNLPGNIRHVQDMMLFSHQLHTLISIVLCAFGSAVLAAPSEFTPEDTKINSNILCQSSAR
jgi:hypothetical protein